MFSSGDPLVILEFMRPKYYEQVKILDWVKEMSKMGFFMKAYIWR